MTATAPARIVRRKTDQDSIGIRVVWTTVGAKLHLALPNWVRTFCQRDIGADMEDIRDGLPAPLCKHCVEQVVNNQRYQRMTVLLNAIRASIAS